MLKLIIFIFISIFLLISTFYITVSEIIGKLFQTGFAEDLGPLAEELQDLAVETSGNSWGKYIISTLALITIVSGLILVFKPEIASGCIEPIGGAIYSFSAGTYNYFFTTSPTPPPSVVTTPVVSGEVVASNTEAVANDWIDDWFTDVESSSSGEELISEAGTFISDSGEFTARLFRLMYNIEEYGVLNNAEVTVLLEYATRHHVTQYVELLTTLIQ